MTNDIPSNLISMIYAIDELNNDTNFDFPIAIMLLKEEQSKDTKHQEALQNNAASERFGMLKFGNISVHDIDGKIIVPTSLQKQVIDWFHTNLSHAGVTQTINSISQSFNWKGI